MAKKQAENNVKITALYCRLSVEDIKDDNGKKHVPIKVHFIGVGILEIPDAQTIIDAKEEIRQVRRKKRNTA